MSIKLNGYNIFVTQGDTPSLTLTLKNVNVDLDGARVVFVVKKRDTDPDSKAIIYYEPSIDYDLNNFTVTFTVQDTSNPVGTYFWGFKIFIGDSFRETPVIGQFHIQKGIIGDGRN